MVVSVIVKREMAADQAHKRIWFILFNLKWTLGNLFYIQELKMKIFKFL